jgi:cytochrome c oxidase assembly protein subunit 17
MSCCSLPPNQSQQKVGIKTGKKICCCCPDTKQARDECVVFKGEEHTDCVKLIEAHKVCLRAEGFDVK